MPTPRRLQDNEITIYSCKQGGSIGRSYNAFFANEFKVLLGVNKITFKKSSVFDNTKCKINLHGQSKSRSVSINIEIPEGTYAFDTEESDGDKLIFYYGN